MDGWIDGWSPDGGILPLLREVFHESDMGLAIIGINTGPERDQSGTAFFFKPEAEF